MESALDQPLERLESVCAVHNYWVASLLANTQVIDVGIQCRVCQKPAWEHSFA